MLSDDITECPHCGDTEDGYRYIEIRKWIQRKGWGNDLSHDSADEDLKVPGQGACRCNNCNKIVKR